MSETQWALGAALVFLGWALGVCNGREWTLKRIARADEIDMRAIEVIKRRAVLEEELRVKQKALDREW